VRTAGLHSKFGVPTFELEEFSRLARAAGARIVGLHAHNGSGIFSVSNWVETAELLAGLAGRFADLRYINIGGGIGVPEMFSRSPLDLAALDAAIAAVRAHHRSSNSGWSRALRRCRSGRAARGRHALKGKGEVRYVGVATGMNSLIRPALYGAWHEIVNLTRLGEPASETCTIVGPICESGDQLGTDRALPPTEEGDVLLIAKRGRLWPRDELALQSAGSGDRDSHLRKQEDFHGGVSGIIGCAAWWGACSSNACARSTTSITSSRCLQHDRAGSVAPAIGRPAGAVRDAKSIAELARLDILISCQGGDYTNEIFPKLRAAGWHGYWIDAASALRMQDDAIIILDPVNREVIEAGIERGVKNFIGGNCTVSLMLMAVSGLVKAGLVEWITTMTYQAASGAGAKQMRELLLQMGSVYRAVEPLLADPASSILDIDRKVSAVLRSLRCRTASSARPSREASFPGSTRTSATDRAARMEGRSRGTQDPRYWRRGHRGRRGLRAHRRHALSQPGPDHQAAQGPAAHRHRTAARRVERLGASHSE